PDEDLALEVQRLRCGIAIVEAYGAIESRGDVERASVRAHVDAVREHEVLDRRVEAARSVEDDLGALPLEIRLEGLHRAGRVVVRVGDVEAIEGDGDD